MYRAGFLYPDDTIRDVEPAVTTALESASLPIPPGARIAVAVGSRGICSIALIVRSAVKWLRAKGAQPFIVPAMGSHGGATAQGQRDVLASLGITEGTVGVPVRSSMETVELDSSGLDVKVFMDRHSWDADGVLLVNRVKPHTDFHGFPESGVLKMSVIGLGKHDQAKAVHGRGIHGLKNLLLPVARRILDAGKVIGGLAVVENAYDRPFRIEAARAEEIEPLERRLLDVAVAAMPRIPLDEVDLLVVDEIGKDISGTCLDTNIIGRIRIAGEAEPDRPNVRSILARRLSPASHGNAIGVGLADVITRELYEAIDFAATYENGLTSSFSERVKIPFVADSDTEAVHAALRFAAIDPDPVKALNLARVVRIRNTLDLSTMLLSRPAIAGLRDGVAGEIDDRPIPLFEAGRFV